MISMLLERSTIYGLLAALCFGAGWKVNGWRLGEGIANDRVEIVTVVRTIERERQKISDAEGAKGHEEIEELRGDVSDANAAADRMRAEASKLATRLATCNAGTAAERKARTDAAGVFAEVLSSVEQEGRRMAEIADRARIAGLTCERVYDGVKAAD